LVVFRNGIEEYKNTHNLSGKAAIDLFNSYHVIECIHSCYEALHATGRQYIVDDIDLNIKAQKPA